jgi:hypothetical protein
LKLGWHVLAKQEHAGASDGTFYFSLVKAATESTCSQVTVCANIDGPKLAFVTQACHGAWQAVRLWSDARLVAIYIGTRKKQQAGQMAGPAF